MHTTKLRIPTSQQQQLDAAIMDGAHRSPAARPPAPPRSKMKVLLLVIATNLVSVYLFSGASLSLRLPAGAAAPSIHLWDSSALLRDLGATRAALAAARAEVAALRAQCNASSLLLESPAPLPGSLWSIPPDTTVNWSPYACKNYTCLVGRARARGGGGGSYECKDCFDLAAGGKERRRWMSDNGGPGFSIDGVLASRAPGTVRLGLDIGGGAGTFAARMRERGVTVVTTTLDVGAPFSAFVASRGLVPLQLSLAQRLPLADGVMDIVHAMQLGGWVPGAVLELALFDVYRVLRPGGVFWLDHFACHGPRLNATYAPILDRVGFRRLRWKASRKLDLGAERNEWYLSALLEKPLT
uniref:Methyltransferase type 11 domain-containing protein n=1 Tax=Oryza barthii TaxID=65489 RepID=A0A0D3FWA6_9ORYZ